MELKRKPKNSIMKMNEEQVKRSAAAALRENRQTPYNIIDDGGGKVGLIRINDDKNFRVTRE
jgi:hypothetical protein